MSNPNPQNKTELEKAVEEFEYQLEHSHKQGLKFTVLTTESSDEILLAANRLKEVEKENEQLKSTIQLMENGKYGLKHMACCAIDKDSELSTLRTEYNNAVEALKDIKKICHPVSDYTKLEIIEEILSTHPPQLQ